MYEKYILRLNSVDGEYYLKKIKAEEALYCAVFGVVDESDIPYTVYQELLLIFNQLFESLTEQETEVLKLRFGFYGEFYSLRKVGEKINLTGECVRQIENKALRKLRHPSRSKKLRTVITRESIMQSSEESNYVRSLVIEKIATYIDGRALDMGFLLKIFQKNGIVITKTPIFIDELDLNGHNTYYCLKKAGINTLYDLMAMTEDELMHIRNLGRKDLEEIQRKVENYKLYSDKYTTAYSNKYITVKLAYNGIEQIYKFKNTTVNEVAKCVYDELAKVYSSKGTIIEYKMSFELKFLLLLKGYFFIENMLEDSQRIINELTLGMYDTYADEYKVVEKQIKMLWDNELNPAVEFLILKNEMVKQIIKYIPKTREDLYECLKSGVSDRDIYLEQLLQEKLPINFHINVPNSISLEEFENNDVIELDDERISRVADLEEE